MRFSIARGDGNVEQNGPVRWSDIERRLTVECLVQTLIESDSIASEILRFGCRRGRGCKGSAMPDRHVERFVLFPRLKIDRHRMTAGTKGDAQRVLNEGKQCEAWKQDVFRLRRRCDVGDEFLLVPPMFDGKI